MYVLDFLFVCIYECIIFKIYEMRVFALLVCSSLECLFFYAYECLILHAFEYSLFVCLCVYCLSML